MKRTKQVDVSRDNCQIYIETTYILLIQLPFKMVVHGTLCTVQRFFREICQIYIETTYILLIQLPLNMVLHGTRCTVQRCTA